MNVVFGFALSLGGVSTGMPVHAQSSQEGFIETRILDFDPQAGVKSQHFYYVDFANQTVTASFVTGTTRISLGIIDFEVSSIRDNFRVSSVSFNSGIASFILEGTTASGIAVMPDIDYRFEITVSKSSTISVRGCHDAYPAYLIQHQGSTVYSFRHESLDLIKLFGTCDQEVNVN
ncbi:DUF3238 domain-containing protein [Fluviibacterium sp. S390]|uniref:DUF3238 domain-containing protein n=1 Tax=Fluviibacterium sp. S390 TaxID=3415139 RepID=UPI003C7C989E